SAANSPSAASARRSRSSLASSSPMPTARISSAVSENDPRATLNSGLAHTTTRVPSPGAGSAASSTVREQITRTATAATGSRKVRNAVLPRLVSSAIWPSTQTRPSLPTHSPTRRSTVRTGTGDSAEVSSGMAPPQRPAGAGLFGGDLRQAALQHGDHVGPAGGGPPGGQRGPFWRVCQSAPPGPPRGGRGGG